jgi:hypothetical protein
MFRRTDGSYPLDIGFEPPTTRHPLRGSAERHSDVPTERVRQDHWVRTDGHDEERPSESPEVLLHRPHIVTGALQRCILVHVPTARSPRLHGDQDQG